jgi:D-inositol-3-phosphate glycosyltransferase
VLLYIGRYAPVKGIDHLLDTIALLKQKHRIHLAILGEDLLFSQTATRIKERIKSLDIENYVNLNGSVEQGLLPFYYSEADIFIVPSFYESFCLASL